MQLLDQLNIIKYLLNNDERHHIDTINQKYEEINKRNIGFGSKLLLQQKKESELKLLYQQLNKYSSNILKYLDTTQKSTLSKEPYIFVLLNLLYDVI
jgi:hypothetical protein